jgi:hypothetical protein
MIAGAFGQTVIRVGAFPNITHPQAMVGKANDSCPASAGCRWLCSGLDFPRRQFFS